MMMNLLKYILLTFLLSFAACSSDDDGVPSVPNGQPQPGDALELTVSAADFVTDGAPDTRATDNDKTTTFENDDRVGVIILDEGDKPIYNNIPYKYNNGKWTFDSGNDEGKGECYYDSKATTFIVYYPYSRAADGVTSVDVLKTKFAPKFNQSDIKDYRSSDLMVWNNSSLTPPVKELNAELKHAYASVFLAPTVGKFVLEDGTAYTGSYAPKVSDISDVSLTIDNTVYIPYQTTDGTLRCIIPANISPSCIRCFYTFGSKTYGNTINISSTGVVANTRYTSAPAIETVPYSLFNAHVGDFYCKNSDDKGYLIPSDVNELTDDQKNACLGIVMKVGKDGVNPWKDDCNYKLKGNTSPMNTIHGYVLALHDANEGGNCQWSSSVFLVMGTNTEKETGFYGYKNTQTIINYAQNNGKNLKTVFPATYHATIGYEGSYPAPTNSSGWFLPSSGQCQYWFTKQNELLPQVKKVIGEDNYWWGWYWSSSETSGKLQSFEVWELLFTATNSPGISRDHKSSKSNKVRSCLAF